MNKFVDFNMKSLVFGAAIAAAFIIFGWQFWDWFYPFSAIGLLYAGYGQNDLKMGAIIGAIASTPGNSLYLSLFPKIRWRLSRPVVRETLSP